MEVLWLTRHSGATLPRDRLLALLGIISVEHDSFLLISHMLRKDGEHVKSLYSQARDFELAFTSHSGGRIYGITQNLQMGMFPKAAQQGAIIFAPWEQTSHLCTEKSEKGRMRTTN